MSGSSWTAGLNKKLGLCLKGCWQKLPLHPFQPVRTVRGLTWPTPAKTETAATAEEVDPALKKTIGKDDFRFSKPNRDSCLFVSNSVKLVFGVVVGYYWFRSFGFFCFRPKPAKKEEKSEKEKFLRFHQIGRFRENAATPESKFAFCSIFHTNLKKRCCFPCSLTISGLGCKILIFYPLRFPWDLFSKPNNFLESEISTLGKNEPAVLFQMSHFEGPMTVADFWLDFGK